jgi:probable phosphoglycerate mutase
MIVIRHGQTNWNAAGRVQGFLDVPLNERGLAQARAIGRALAHEPIDAIYSSDLDRTRSTAAPLARRKRLPIQTDPRFREWNLGLFENLTIHEARVCSPVGYDAYRNMTVDFVIPEGESLRAFAARCIEGIDDLVRAHPGKRLALFTHGGVVINYLRRAESVAEDEPLRYLIPNVARIDFRFRLEDDRVVWLGYESDLPLKPHPLQSRVEVRTP